VDKAVLVDIGNPGLILGFDARNGLRLARYGVPNMPTWLDASAATPVFVCPFDSLPIDGAGGRMARSGDGGIGP
jgi:hypothetical protein